MNPGSVPSFRYFGAVSPVNASLPALQVDLYRVVRVRGFKKAPFLLASLCLVAATLFSTSSAAQSKDEVAPTLSSAHRGFTVFAPRGRGTEIRNVANARESSPPDIDSITTFTGQFEAAGVGITGKPQKKWHYEMAGGAPELGGTTWLDASIVPVSLDLLDYGGAVRVVKGQKLQLSVKPYVNAVVNSPLFRTAEYTSSDVATQFVDSVQRAEFYNVMQPDWHTLLRPSIKAERRIAVPRGSYFFALEDDGSCCAFVLVDINVFSNLLFPASATDTRSPVGSAEHAGDITTRSIATFLFPNTFLYLHADPNRCCVLGFHTYDFEAVDGRPEKRYVLNFASWISADVFGPGFADIAALSHEMTESINDPFVGSDGVHGMTPWWLSENGNCQDDLEPGDVIEGLPDATIAIKTKDRTYHLQNEALLQWFEFQSPSTAIAGAYSYPNENVLTSLSPLEGVNCK
jgi:hypothetical protein